MLRAFRGESRAALERGQEAVELCSRHGFAYYLAMANVLTGWARAAEGDVAVIFVKSWPKRPHYGYLAPAKLWFILPLPASGELTEVTSMPHDRSVMCDCLVDDGT
jgi:hypothetical protein